MTDPYIQSFEKTQIKEETTSIQVGDIVVVHKMISEGKKKRIQRFQGTVVRMKGSHSRRSFTVRKIIDGVGVEKTFLLHSPLVPTIEIIKRSKVRRAKLYYLRGRIGAKANRLKVREDSRQEAGGSQQSETSKEPKKSDESVSKKDDTDTKKKPEKSKVNKDTDSKNG